MDKFFKRKCPISALKKYLVTAANSGLQACLKMYTIQNVLRLIAVHP